MKSIFLILPATAAVALSADIIAPGDPVLAIDRDLAVIANSDYPSNDSAASGIDRRNDTKYANTGGAGAGVIVTPAAGASTVRSFVVTTASDFADRDPASYALYGTNDPVTSEDNSRGDGENWTLLQEGTVTLPTTRLTAGAAVAVTNETAHTSYRIVFPTLRNNGSGVLQFAEIQFYSTANGTGTPILAAGDPALAIHRPALGSSSPDNEQAINLLDSSAGTKYLNFGKLNTGFIVTPVAGASTALSFLLTTANDAEERDPASYVLYGTNDDILSAPHGTGAEENWTEIASGALTLPPARQTAGDLITVSGAVAYKSYKMLFPAVKNAATANSMQLADVQLYSTADASDAGILSFDDPILPIQGEYDNSGYRTNNEKPQNAVDGLATTKYLNFGEQNSGIIITPAAASTARSLVITTANDAPQRDPATYALYGTNAAVVSGDNSTGAAEAWTLISKGALSLPDDRGVPAPAVNFAANSASYTSYRLVFPAVKDPNAANSMQIAEVQLYTAADGGGTGILAPASSVKAIKLASSVSGYPGAENPANILDGDPNTKYLNFSKRSVGFIVTPAVGAKAVQSLAIATANDSPERDPGGYEFYGTNDPVVSGDNSDGSFENWTLVSSGALTLLDDRLYVPLLPDDAVSFTNTTAYTSYRLIFPSVKNDAAANSMQIGDVQFYTAAGGGGEPVLAAGDAIKAVSFLTSSSGAPGNEGVELAVDGSTGSKYLNTGGVNSGLIITPSGGSSVVTGLRLYTANDAEGRDPAAYEISGTNSPLASLNHSTGDAEPWTLISSGTIELPADRNGAEAAVTFANSAAYTSYRLVFTGLKDNGQGLMQVSEVQLDGAFGSVPTDPSFVISAVSFTGNPVTGVTVTWTSEVNASYTVQSSPDLTTWTGVGDHTAGGTTTSAAFAVPAGERRFFRVIKN